MARILSIPFFRHLRTAPTAHVLHFRRGRRVRSGKGLAFWYRPLVSGLAEIPTDDREQPFLCKGRTRDFQDVTVQGAITYRIADPERIAARVDFSIDVDRGNWLQKPLEQLATLVTQLAQQVALDYLAHEALRTALQDGVQALRTRIEQALGEGAELGGLGLELVAVRISTIAPSNDLERALQAPTREAIQQAADEAAFQRRALAVEKERAIAENELHNKIELARRGEQLIQQEGANDRRRQEEVTAAKQITAHGEAAMQRLRAESDAATLRTHAAAEAESIEKVEGARNVAEAARLAAFGALPPAAAFALALRELAGKLERIDHLNLAPDAFGPLLQNLLGHGVRHLEAKA